MLQIHESGREILWRHTIDVIERYAREVNTLPVSPSMDPAQVRALLSRVDFQRPWAPSEAVTFAAEGLTRFQVHTPHRRYFGLFNPAPTTMGIAADTLAAAFNPQLAAWSHNPFANEVELMLVRELGARFGFENCDGTFASGGMEANHTSVLTALARRFPSFAEHGVRGLERAPVLYASAESHHSLLKAARLCGLGDAAVRKVGVDDDLRMSVPELRDRLQRDVKEGCAPFLIAATAGTTNAGAIDPLGEIALIARECGAWFHVDAAWGGGAALVPELRPLLDGIELADSITFDAHKWMSTPMGAGVYLTRHRDILDRTFRVQTAYMPKDAAGLDVIDPHLHSMQWSRRFIGLKVLLSLMVAGWDGYAETVRHQTRMGEYLRDRLRGAGWTIENRTPLPVVCFSAPNASGEQQREIARRVVESGDAWISPTLLAGTRAVLRACITHYATQPSDIDALLESVDRARSAL